MSYGRAKPALTPEARACRDYHRQARSLYESGGAVYNSDLMRVAGSWQEIVNQDPERWSREAQERGYYG